MGTGLSGYVVLAGMLLAGALLFAVAMIARRMIAPRVPTRAKQTTYESGVDPVTGGWAQTQIRYLAYAFLYVVFAVDAVYLFPWALLLRDVHLGVTSLVEMGIFLAVLVVALAHAARRGLLAWVGTSPEGGAAHWPDSAGVAGDGDKEPA